MYRHLRKLALPALLATSLSAASVGFAQDRDRDRTRDPAADADRVQDRDRIADQDRIADRDRIQDREQDRLQDRDQDRLQTRDADRDQDRDRLQLHVQDRDQLRARDVYGYELMTRQERREYRARIRDLGNVREWARYRAEHQARMTARAREQGAELPAPFYGQQLMTDQERLRLRERLENATSAQARERIRNEHREQMQQRARDNAIPLSELE